jgi:hypothetical protein
MVKSDESGCNKLQKVQSSVEYRFDPSDIGQKCKVTSKFLLKFFILTILDKIICICCKLCTQQIYNGIMNDGYMSYTNNYSRNYKALFNRY